MSSPMREGVEGGDSVRIKRFMAVALSTGAIVGLMSSPLVSGAGASKPPINCQVKLPPPDSQSPLKCH